MRESTLRMSAGALIGAAILIGAACAPDSSSITRPDPAFDAARGADPSRIGGPLQDLNGVGSQFYPLELGNRWQHQVHFVVELQPTRGPSEVIYDQRRPVDREIVCKETVGGKTYTIERETDHETEPALSWVWWRQDRAGLYERDVSINVAPPCDDPIRGSRVAARPAAAAAAALDRALAGMGSERARAAWRAAWQVQQQKLDAIHEIVRGGFAVGASSRGLRTPPEGELLRLSYPLRPGAHWLVRISPRFGSSVEAHETLVMPAGRFQGYRIPITSEFFGPEDRVVSWYGRDGFLRLSYHLVSAAVDEQGNPVGTVLSDYDEVLTEIALVGRTAGEPKLAGR